MFSNKSVKYIVSLRFQVDERPSAAYSIARAQPLATAFKDTLTLQPSVCLQCLLPEIPETVAKNPRRRSMVVIWGDGRVLTSARNTFAEKNVSRA